MTKDEREEYIDAIEPDDHDPLGKQCPECKTFLLHDDDCPQAEE